MNNAMKLKYLVPVPFRKLEDWNQKCQFIDRIIRSRHRGKFKSSECLAMVTMVTHASTVVSLIHEECEDLLEDAINTMDMEQVPFDALFEVYLSTGSRRTEINDKYLKGDYDGELMEYGGATLPLSAKKLVNKFTEEISKTVALRQNAKNKQLVTRRMKAFS